MRREELYLRDIVEAADAVRSFLEGVEQGRFEKDDLTRSAVLQKLMIIGEAAARLPQEFKEKHPEVEWADIVAFRNIVVHTYFSVEWNIVWVTAQSDVPDLRKKIARVLETDCRPESKQGS